MVQSVGPTPRAIRIYGSERVSKPRDAWDTYCEFEFHAPSVYAEWLLSGDARRRHAYLAQAALDGSDLAARLEGWMGELCRRFFPGAIGEFNLWLGPGGHREPLHFDPTDGLLFQLHGEKHVILAAPRQSRNLYPFPFWSRIRPWFSKVSLRTPDVERYPRLKGALKETITLSLQPGMALFIPAGWWHEISSLGENYTCSINRFFRVRPLRRLMTIHFGIPLYFAYVNRPTVVAVEALFRRLRW
ncbi:MAG: cupin-like domain-containing protein [Alphaproteobacteria bacterium]|nr:cupin-like domain-containing protein [Alphaproteobacteria bacterium]